MAAAMAEALPLHLLLQGFCPLPPLRLALGKLAEEDLADMEVSQGSVASRLCMHVNS